VYEAVSKSNINVGGDVVAKGDQAYVVRGIGLLEKKEDIENIQIEVKGSTPILVKHVAEVKVSAKPRLGQVGYNKENDVVEGIVIMLRGENPSEVIARLKDRIEELNGGELPGDVQIVPIIDRTELVNTTVHTVSKTWLKELFWFRLLYLSSCTTGEQPLLWHQLFRWLFFLQLLC
jgi:cobalt-zinc-cadmium resistance protein CzcA